MDSMLNQLTLIVVLGIGASWLAYRLHLPSILLLLASGFLAGPVMGWIQPDVLFGDALFPFVSLAVAVILFEGGLSLSFRDVKEAKNAVSRLVLLGAVITWVLSTLAIHYIADLSWQISLLAGAILVVTGPTVIIPLLHFIRPTGRAETVAKWEGIVNDPIGAILAVLVYEGIVASKHGEALWHTIGFLAGSVGVGALTGIAGALILWFLMKHRLVPDHLHNPMSLMLALGFFTLSNHFYEESGLLTVTLMGILLANQKQVQVKHILEFKEELRVLLISLLFVTLSARLEISVIKQISYQTLLFLGAMIFIVRPIAVFLSTVKTELTTEEKWFLTCMAPRGIVAAAVASIFSIELAHLGVPDSDKLLPLIFMIIVGTVTFYGLSARPLARKLGIAAVDSQGVLIVGAHDWAREFAKALQDCGITTRLVDTNRFHIRQAKLEGLDASQGNILSENALVELDLSSMGYLLALTQNDEVNALAALHCAERFDRESVYQLAPKNQERDATDNNAIPKHLRGRVLANDDLNYNVVDFYFENGATLKTTQITERFTMQDFTAKYGSRAFPLFHISDDGKLSFFHPTRVSPKGPGQVIALLREAEA